MEKKPYATIHEDGFHIQLGHEHGKTQTVICSEVRGAVIPPTPSDPGYYLIFGQKPEENQNSKKPLVFLTENQSRFQDDLITKLISDSLNLMCQVIYVDPNSKGFVHSISRQAPKLKDTRICPAIFDADDEYGIVQIKQWLHDNALEIPKSKDSVLRKELEKMTIDSTSYVLAPLSFIIAGFENHKIIEVPFEEKCKLQNQEGLTGASLAAWRELDYQRKMIEQREEDDPFGCFDGKLPF